MARVLSIESILRAQEELMATKPAIGYTQNAIGRRKAVNPKTLKWVPGTSSDCSFISVSVMIVAGLVLSGWQKITLFSGNIISVLTSTGLYRKIDVSKHRTLSSLRAALRPGDVMAGPGHVITVGRDGKRWLSWEHDERGREDGGKPGWQKGEKTGWRLPYMRSRGWTAVARLISPLDFLGRILAAYAKGKSWKAPLDLFGKRSPSDVIAWRHFMDKVNAYTNGIEPNYSPAFVSGNHFYVVLGGSIAQMKHRVLPAIIGLKTNPDSFVIVTGGVKRISGGKTKTEAEWMRDMLVTAGIDPKRIILETHASSTVGNARYALPILVAKHATSATVVSFDSHVRRAQILFLAAKLSIETEGVGLHPTGIIFNRPLAYPDKHVAKTKASAATRAFIASNVAAVLGLTKQYKNAL